MRLVMLTWEYPPKIVGGIARHVEELSKALIKQGIEVHVVTADHPNTPAEEQEGNLYIHRVTPLGRGTDFLQWVQLLNQAMKIKCEELIDAWIVDQTKNQILIHAHDWLAEDAAVHLKHLYKLPMLSTIHATEHGRMNGIGNDIQRYIDNKEKLLANESWRVIACSHYMFGEITYALQINGDKIDVIYNGVDASKFEPKFLPEERAAFRNQYATSDEKLIFYVGRFVREKGIHILLDSIPKVKAAFPKAKFIVVGGGWREHFVNFTRFIGVEKSVVFTGFVPDETLLKIYRIVDAAVFPSLYEPFGIVALEAMAAKVPVIVSDAGGLKEIVQHGETGTITWLNNSDSLAHGILNVLSHPTESNKMTEKAYKRVTEVFNWNSIATQTIEVYNRIWAEYESSGW